MQRCTHCGVVKPMDTFRSYYNRPGNYKMCKECEALEAKYSRLKRASRNAKQQAQFEMLGELFEKRRAAGLITPGIKAAREEFNQEQLRKSIEAADVLMSQAQTERT